MQKSCKQSCKYSCEQSCKEARIGSYAWLSPRLFPRLFFSAWHIRFDLIMVSNAILIVILYVEPSLVSMYSLIISYVYLKFKIFKNKAMQKLLFLYAPCLIYKFRMIYLQKCKVKLFRQFLVMLSFPFIIFVTIKQNLM